MKPKKFLIFKKLFQRRVQVSYKEFLIKKECILKPLSGMCVHVAARCDLGTVMGGGWGGEGCFGWPPVGAGWALAAVMRGSDFAGDILF